MLTPTIDSAPSNTPSTTRSTDLGNKEIFLKLLVAQMRFQDPLNPQDPTQMSSQLAQFNMVEQQTNTNKLLEQLISAGNLQRASSGVNAASYLGHTAVIASDTIHFTGAAVPFSIKLGANATDVRVQIVDASGAPVRAMSIGPLSGGITQTAWDGRDDNGALAANGTYRIIVQASDSEGLPIPAEILRQGVVSAVRFNGDEPLFVVDGVATPRNAIQEIRP